MKLLGTINLDNVSSDEIRGYKRRFTARGVVIDSHGDVALIRVTERGYLVLPGGGLEKAESPEQAFVRECLEETGCQVTISHTLGHTDEYNSKLKRFQTTYAYVGSVIGPKGKPRLKQDEITAGFAVEWLPLIQAAGLLAKQLNQQRTGAVRDELILKTAIDSLTG